MPLKLALPLTALFFLQCAGGYTPPSANPTVFTYDIPLAKTALFAKSSATLKDLGYTFVVEDPELGQIRTTPQAYRFTAGDCDCGEWYRKPEVLDKATALRIEIILSIREGGIDFSTKYSAEHRNTAGKIDRRPECVSLGQLEKQLVDAIVAKKLD